MNTEWKNAILAEIRDNPGVTSAGPIECLLDTDYACKWRWEYTPQHIYRDLYTLEKRGEITRTDDKPKRCYIAKSEPDEVWVMADFVPSRNRDKITAGKPYRFALYAGDGGFITDNRGHEIYLYLPSCSYLDDEPWRKVPKPAEYATPETKDYHAYQEQIDTLSAKVDELTAWKANAIAKHPDLDASPVLIKARELFSEIPNDCVETACTMRGENDRHPAMVKLIGALGGT